MGICRTKWFGITCAKKSFFHQDDEDDADGEFDEDEAGEEDEEVKADATFRKEAALLAPKYCQVLLLRQRH